MTGIDRDRCADCGSASEGRGDGEVTRIVNIVSERR